ncbi:MAG: hypothetical protein QOJ27_2925 [Sphingomonadales bacterium]|nr:hypothetical protein [Sphingomonadales bacterium]
MNKTIIGPLLAGLLFSLAGCGPGISPSDKSENSAVPANNAAAAAPKPARPAPEVVAPLVLEGSGLGLASGTLPFGTPKAAAVEAVAKALGRAPSKRGLNQDCGGGGMEFAEWKDEITLWFEEGSFAGWDSNGELKTAGGVGIGSGRAQVAALPGFEVEESTLGTEFRAGGLSGILASAAPGAKVTNLWGGATCVFR